MFLKAINEESNTFQPLLNTHFRAFSDLIFDVVVGFVDVVVVVYVIIVFVADIFQNRVSNS